MKKISLAAALCASLLAGNAFAGSSSPFYLGATLGQSSVDSLNDCVGSPGNTNTPNAVNTPNIANTTVSCSIGDGDTTMHIYGGVQLSDSIAVEIGYADLGSTGSYSDNNQLNLNQDTSGYTLAGVMRHRMGKTSPLHVYGKAGVFHWTSEASSGGAYPGSAEASGTSPLAGVGVEYELSHNLSVKAGWDRYFGVGEDEDALTINNSNYEVNTLETDVDVYSAGINFSFL